MTRQTHFIIAIGLIIVVALLIGLLPGTPSVTAAPPPRATLTPTPYSMPSAGNPFGSYIELRLPTDNINLWTVVQWQDSLGGWHDVETWRGILDEINRHKGDKLWWVYPRDYGKGPFRWQVYQSPGGALLATSSSFNLPAAANQRVIVEVTLK
jgi:hypothetical protein